MGYFIVAGSVNSANAIDKNKTTNNTVQIINGISLNFSIKLKKDRIVTNIHATPECNKSTNRYVN